MLLRALVTEFDFLGELIADIDHDIRILAAPWTEQLHLLMTLPGVDISSAWCNIPLSPAFQLASSTTTAARQEDGTS